MAVEKKQLESIFGKKRVHDDKESLEQYAQDQSFAPKRMPDFVVFAETVEEVQQVVKLANETLTPVIPFSSGLNFHGAALPDHGGIVAAPAFRQIANATLGYLNIPPSKPVKQVNVLTIQEVHG